MDEKEELNGMILDLQHTYDDILKNFNPVKTEYNRYLNKKSIIHLGFLIYIGISLWICAKNIIFAFWLGLIFCIIYLATYFRILWDNMGW